jgi:hypothetical protein
MNSELATDAVMGIPQDYVVLLIGMAIGFLMGWLAGRLTSGGPRDIGQVQAPGMDSRSSQEAGQAISVVVNRKTVNLEPAQTEEIQKMIRQRRMIDAIKRLREITGLGLAEAKAVAESLPRVGR